MPESTVVGTVAVTVKSSDADIEENNDVAYAITAGNTDGAFGIDPETGEISVDVALSTLETDVYTLTVEAVDFGEAPVIMPKGSASQCGKPVTGQQCIYTKPKKEDPREDHVLKLNIV